jgi:LysR family positive regulator for ilvC
MNDVQLRCFVALGETFSFTRASERCFLSPSAFSRVISRTEQELGSVLCLRNNREVRLTPAGRRFLLYARENLHELRQLREELSADKSELDGELSIFATVTACYSILPGMLAPFRRRHPKVGIHLRTGDAADALAMVRSELADCAIAPIPESGVGDLFVEHLTVTPLVFVAPKNLEKKQFIRVSEADDDNSDNGTEEHSPDSSSARFSDHYSDFTGELDGFLRDFPKDALWNRIPVILPERGLGRQRIDRWFASRGIEPNILAQVSGNEGILAMVKLGLGIGLVPELVVKNSPMAEGLEILPHLDRVPDFGVGVAVKKRNAELPEVRAFIEAARTGFRSESEG